MKYAKLIFVLFLISGYSAHSQCHYIRVDSQGVDTVSFTFNGGSITSYGCGSIDPTYWLAGNGNAVTATFLTPQSFPSFRIWGMNDDDFASVNVNGLSYPLNAGTASYDPKVICGISPGPDGVIFTGGTITGANSPALGNYSYQDVQLNAINVSSITVTGLSGAGWGFAGVSVDCPLTIGELSQYDFGLQTLLFPNPASDEFTVALPIMNDEINITVIDMTGNIIRNEVGINKKQLTVSVSDLSRGVYFVQITGKTFVEVKRVIVVK